MPIRTRRAALAFAATLLGSGPALPAAADPNAVLAGIKKRVASDYARLPNYTCRETIERSARPLGSHKWSKLDSLRLDVALIGGHELFAWPGSSKFEEKPIDQMVQSPGAIGSGMFASHLRSLFLTEGPQFYFAGDADFRGRKAVRFDFKVPRGKSGFEVGDGEHTARVAYAGSFLADGNTLELLQLSIQVNEVPAPLRITGTRDTIEYSKVRIGEADFLLPAMAEMIMIGRNGETRNLTRLDACRQYVGESVVSFGEAPAAEKTAKQTREIELAAGLAIEVLMQTQIGASSAVGDPVEAVLPRALKANDGSELLPKGARFTGRITRLERRMAGHSIEYSVIGVTFTAVEAPGLKAAFHGDLESVGVTTSRGAEFHVPYATGAPGEINIWTRLSHETARPQPDEGVFYVRRSAPETYRGLRMLWRTTVPRETIQR